MDASSFGDRRASNRQLAQLIQEIAEHRSNTNLSEKVLNVLLEGQVIRFLDDIDLLTALLTENNRLSAELIARMSVQPCDQCADQLSLHLHQ